jgi:hypothetical protein
MTLASRARVGTVGRDLPQIDRIAQHPAERGTAPLMSPVGRGRPLAREGPDHAPKRRPVFQIACEEFLDHGPLCRVDTHPTRITWSVWVDTVALRHAGPGQQRPRAQLVEPSAPHPLGNEGPLLFGHRSANLQQQLVMRVVTHRAVEELDDTAEALQFLQQEHLAHILAGQAIRRRHEDALDLSARDRVAQRVQTWTA